MGKRIKITRDDLVRMRGNGLSKSAAAKLFGVTSTTVNSACKRVGFARWSDIPVNGMAKAIDEKKTDEELRAMFAGEQVKEFLRTPNKAYVIMESGFGFSIDRNLEIRQAKREDIEAESRVIYNEHLKNKSSLDAAMKILGVGK